MTLWTIVLTKPSAEEVAEKALRGVGYRVALPRYRKKLMPHGQGRKSGSSMRPLFQGIIFVQDWSGWPAQPINGIAGVMQTRTARGDQRAAKLSDDDMQTIIDKERALVFDEIRHPPGSLPRVRDDVSVGDKVEFEVFGARVMAELAEALSDNGKAVVRDLISGRRWSVQADTLQLVAS